MKAARIHRYGGNEVVVIEEIPRPEPGPGEVLLRVTAAGVNPVDWKLRSGYLQGSLPIQFPLTLGCDVAGIVEVAGSGVNGFKDGAAVFGYPNLLRCGAYAEYAILSLNEVAAVPAGLPLEDAASLPVAGITAWDGLFTHGKLEKGQRVLILGGAGGVGSAAIQLAVWKGAEVYATASARNQDTIRALGAIPIDYSSQATTDVVKAADLILDCVGGESASQALPSLKHGGIFATTVYGLPDAGALAAVAAQPKVFGIQPSVDLLQQIAALAATGKLKLHIEKIYSLDETALALAASEAGRTRGKLLVKP